MSIKKIRISSLIVIAVFGGLAVVGFTSWVACLVALVICFAAVAIFALSFVPDA